MDRLEQLRKFVAWEREHHDQTHIAEWALHEIERLQAQSEFYRQMRNANERKLAKPPSAPVGAADELERARALLREKGEGEK